MKFKLKCLVLLFLNLFCAMVLGSNEPAPLVMLERASNQLITELKKNQAKIKNQPEIVNQLISRTLLPHFDIEGIARSTVGHYWKNASPAEQSQFKKQVISLVIKNYSAPLASFDDDKIQFHPLRGFSASQNVVEVKSLIIRKNGQKIPMTYYLGRSGKHWKVRDFSVEGISMVQSYRSQFMPILSGKGFKGLLGAIRSRG